jgi:hypothetical protein
VARKSFRFGPQSPNLPIFGLIFDENNMKIGKNLTNLARECFSNTMKFELCIPALNCACLPSSSFNEFLA